MPDNRPMNTIPRLIAARVDYYGEHEPQRSYASVPLTDRLEDGYREITYQMLASAVDRAAWWLDSMLPIAQGSTPPQTFAYFGPNDLRYTILALAGIKTNRKVRLISRSIHHNKSLNMSEFADPTAVPMALDRKSTSPIRCHNVSSLSLHCTA